MVDDHFYPSASWFNDNAGIYDTANRNGPRVLVGEYGAAEGNPTGTLNAAVGEAAFLTGVERNSDVVIGAMYAPVLVNENAVNWAPDLIGFNAGTSYGSPSYQVEKLFAENTGKDVLASSATGQGGLKQVVTKTTEGGRTTFYLKIVNFSSQQQSAKLNFKGVSRFDEGTQSVITGDPAAVNTITNQTKIAPTVKTLSGISLTPRFSFPGKSVTVIKLVGALGDPTAPPATTAPPVPVDIGGSVPATLALTLGASPAFAPFVPGVAADYTASTTATVTSSAGDATLSVTDPSTCCPGAPGQRDVLAGAAAARERRVLARGGEDVWGAGQQRRVLARLQAVDRGQRGAAHGALRQDVDVHVVHDNAVEGPAVNGEQTVGPGVKSRPGRPAFSEPRCAT